MSDKLSIIRNDIQTIREEFLSINTANLKFDKEVEFAIQILSKNDYLAGANPLSIRNAVRNCAATELTLNPTMKMAYLIPRMEKVNGRKELQCVLEPSYIGLCKILTDTGSVKGISATIVYEKEAPSLKVQQGINGHASHTPYIGFDKPGKPIACYSKAILPDGTEHIELLRPWEWEDIMQRSESVKSYYAKQQRGEYAPVPTWFSDMEEMIRKTCIKKHYKYLPKSKRAEQIAAAIALDDEANGINFEQSSRDAAKEKAKNNPVKLDVLDPANEDDNKLFEAFIALFDPEVMPSKLNDGKIDVASSKAVFEQEYAEGKLLRAKIEKWEPYLKKQFDHFKANPVQKEEQPEQQNAEDFE